MNNAGAGSTAGQGVQRQLSLDVLRGIAVLLVIVRHCDVSDPVLATIKRGGWIGVDLFFVLSGFLVSGLLFKQQAKEGRIHASQFLLRRAFKIYPAFWVLIAASVAIFAAFGAFAPSKLVAELLFIQSYCSHRLWSHTWSLAVEEHFYVLLPLLLIPLARDKFAALPRIVAYIMAGLLVARCVNGWRPFSEQSHLFPTHLRLDGLFFGVLLSHWHRSWPAFNDCCRRYSRLLIVGGSVLLAPAFVLELETTPAIYTYWLSAQIVGSGALLMGLVCGGVPKNAATGSLGCVGKYSYSIYLWHNGVILVLVPLLGLAGLAAVAATLAASVAIGIVMSELVETPMLRIRDRLLKPTPA